MRSAIEGRPLLLFALTCCLGLIAKQLPWSAALLLIPVLLLKEPKRRALAVAGWAVGLVFAPMPPMPLTRIGEYEGGIWVKTVPMPDRKGGERAVAQTARGILLVSFPPSISASLGDRWTVRGYTRALTRAEAIRWRLRGVQGTLTVYSALPTESGPAWFRLGRAWRDSFRAFTRQHLPEDQANLLDALCFNVDAALDTELSQTLRRAGVIHIVSASGLHITIFALALQALFSRLPFGRVWQLLLLLAILAIYAGAAGLRPPVFRAVVMAGVGLFAYAFRRESDTLSSLALAALLQLGLDPRAVFDLGFQLSYLIVGALALFVRYPTSSERGIWEWTRETVHSSCVATLAASPLLAYAFGSVSVVAVLANLAIAPLVLPVMAGSLSAWLVGQVWPAGGAALLAVCGALTTGIRVVADAFGGLPFAAVNVEPFPGWLLPIIYVLLLTFYRPARRPVPLRRKKPAPGS